MADHLFTFSPSTSPGNPPQNLFAVFLSFSNRPPQSSENSMTDTSQSIADSILSFNMALLAQWNGHKNSFPTTVRSHFSSMNAIHSSPANSCHNKQVHQLLRLLSTQSCLIGRKHWSYYSPASDVLLSVQMKKKVYKIQKMHNLKTILVTTEFSLFI